MPVRQKTKVCLIAKYKDKDGNVRVHRRYTTKPKPKGGANNSKLVLRKYCPETRSYLVYTETKIKWKT